MARIDSDSESAATRIVQRMSDESRLFAALESAASRKDVLRLHMSESESVYAVISLEKRNGKVTRATRREIHNDSVVTHNLIVFKLQVVQYNPAIAADSWIHSRVNPTESVLESVSLAIHMIKRDNGAWIVGESFGFERKAGHEFTFTDSTSGEYNPLIASFVNRVVSGRKARDSRNDTESVNGESVRIDRHYDSFRRFTEAQ
jgi:hypothetical protein